LFIFKLVKLGEPEIILYSVNLETVQEFLNAGYRATCRKFYCEGFFDMNKTKHPKYRIYECDCGTFHVLDLEHNIFIK